MTKSKRFFWGRPSACLRLALVCLVPVLLATCGQDGPGGPSGPPVIGRIEFTPGPIMSGGHFGPNLPIDQVHILIVRPPTTTLHDTTRAFSLNANRLRIDLPVLLTAAAESLDVTLELLSGTTVLFSGTSRLEAKAGPPSATPPPAIPLIYSGPGSLIAHLSLSPLDSVLGQGDSLIMQVTGMDTGQLPVPAFYVGWSSSDTTVAQVNGAGVVRGRVPRGTVFIRARTPDTQLFPSGIVESTTVTLVPDPASLTKLGGDNQSAPVGSRLAQLLEVEVLAADGLPVPGATVTFATTATGATVDSASATSDANGVARTGVVLGSVVGTQIFTAGSAGTATVTFTANASVTPSPTWTGAVSTDWHNANNWNLGFVPGVSDSVTIPAGPANQPTLVTSGATVGALLVDGTLTLTNFGLIASGNVRGAGSITSGGVAGLDMTTAGTTLDLATLPSVGISGAVALGRTVNITGNLNIGGAGDLTFANHTANVTGDVTTFGTGTITMTGAVDSLKVLGRVTFAGGSTFGKISSGVIFLRGNFTQQAGTSAQSYAPTGNHILVFNGTGVQTVNFASPGATGSNFETLAIANSAGGVTLASDVFLSGPVGFAPGVPRIAHGSGQTLFVAELRASNATLDNILVAANNVLLTQFDSINFINYNPAATPLTISHPGSATPFVMNDLSFGVTPTSGFYISVTDLVADANVLTINMVNPTPGASGGLVQTAGGAVVNWPFVPAGARTWTGAIDNDWFTPGNWSPAAVPTGTDDVIISNTSIHPVLAGAASVRDLTVQAGVVLTLNADLAVTGSASLQSTTIGTGSILMVTHGAGVQGTLRNLKINLATRFESIFVTGNVIASGVVEVQRGHLDVGANTVTTNTFVTSGEGMLKMTQAAGTLIVNGNATFGGEDPTGVLTAGTIHVRGHFNQLTVITQGSFVATGTNRVILDGTTGQVVSFQHPGASHFQDLEFANTTDTVYVGGGWSATGQLIKQVGGSVVVSGAAQLISANGAAISGIEFNNARVALLSGTVTQFDNVSWTGFASFVTQLTVTRPTGTLNLFNHSFATTPTTGFYLRADDTNPSDGQPLTINMMAPTPATPGGFVQTAGGAVVNWPPAPGGTVIWTGAVSTDWNLPGNWSINGVPTFTDSVVIPAGGNQPSLTAPGVAGALHLANGTLTINGMSLVVIGNFYSTGSGLLVMTNAADAVSIGGNALFDGGNQLGFMSAGTLILGGNLTQQNSTSLDSYHPSGTHTTVFNGGSTQTIRFFTPGLAPGSSHFQEVIWPGNADLIFLSDVYAHGTFTAFAQVARTISSGSGALKLATGGWSSGLNVTTLDNIQLVIDQATPTILNVNNLAFVNQPSDVIQLQVGHPGSGGAFSFTNLNFSSVPTTGFYLSATDLNGADGLPFTIDMVNPSPGTPGAFVQTVGGAVVNWPGSGGGSAVWTGASNNQVWNDAGNWAGNVVPSPGADVLIPAAASSFPALVASHQVNNLVVEPGATVFFVGGAQGFIEITGDLTGGGSMSGGGPTMSGIGRTIEMADVGGTLRITGSVSMGANLAVTAGDLQIHGASAHFDVNGFTLDLFNNLNIGFGGGTLQMTDPAGVVNVQSHAIFDGGSEIGLLTAGVLRVGADFIQGSSTSNTSFAASGSHVTILGRPTSLRAVLFATPGSGTNGSHFNALDVSAATGGLGLGSDIFVDSALISTTASASLQGSSFSVTSRRWLVSGLSVNNAPMILDEQGVPASETFSNVTFSGFPASGTTMMTVTGPGDNFAPRPAVTTANVNFQSLGIGAGNLYVKLTSTNGQLFTMNMTGSNQSPQAAGNGPGLSDPPNQTTVAGARINWP